ncbi:uncharacterized protein LOC121834262 [Ixodes scapularis]|uniref:uncharacterized protein LOC121834262 n=1 Tax=Ixodes scapularis TaxID=6945 RepID=UPI001C392F05|nr:uncharacterized protein LOC121834262 [Ixodes scapularis]
MGNTQASTTATVTPLLVPSSSEDDALVTHPLSSIKMPLFAKPHGRPKGVDMVVIGLPKKKARKAAMESKAARGKSSTPVAFAKLPAHMMQHKMLMWFVDEKDATYALQHNTLLDETKVEVLSCRIPDAALDETVDLDIIKDNFTEDGWFSVTNIVNVKKRTHKWNCNYYKDPLDETACHACDA